jgi:hypothetical protein
MWTRLQKIGPLSAWQVCKMVSFSQRVAVPDDVLMREVRGEALLLNLKTEIFLSLDAVGASMWKQLTGASSIQTAYEALLDEFDVDPDTLKHDLAALIDDLLRQGLISLSDS